MTMTAPFSTRTIGGFPIVETSADALIALLQRRRDERQPTELMFANTNFIVGCHPLAGRLQGPETLIVNDGVGVDLAARLFTGSPFPENLNGTDFVPRLLASVTSPTRLFLLGARVDVAHAAANVWSRLHNIEIVGIADGYTDLAADDDLVARIAGSGADILLVALGDPLQACWIAAHRGRHRVPCVIAVGALFDFVSGHAARAPVWIRRLRFEWLFRLLREPQRLLKRYSVDLVVFFAHCLGTHRAVLRGRPPDTKTGV